jgi:hypothetical protein
MAPVRVRVRRSWERGGEVPELEKVRVSGCPCDRSEYIRVM